MNFYEWLLNQLKGQIPKRTWNEETSVEGLCSLGASKKGTVGSALEEQVSVPRYLAHSKMVPRQLAQSREGHAGHSWAACGATFPAIISHNLS